MCNGDTPAAAAVLVDALHIGIFLRLVKSCALCRYTAILYSDALFKSACNYRPKIDSMKHSCATEKRDRQRRSSQQRRHRIPILALFSKNSHIP